MIVGIDYSMTSPAICVCPGEFKYENCKFMYITQKKSLVGVLDHYYTSIVGYGLFEWEDNIDRFNKLAKHTMDFIALHHLDCPNEPLNVGIEGYAFGAKGQVFNIGENTGILKHFLSLKDIQPAIYAPSAIKKFATGKGNANKELMYEAFYAETGDNLMSKFGIKKDAKKIPGPITDIVDAYYIAKLQSTM